MKFTLEIQLGNEAMQTGRAIAEAIQDSLSRHYITFQGHRPTIGDNMSVRDLNGNRVGKWEVVE